MVYFLSLDIGTSYLKAAVFRADASLAFYSSAKYKSTDNPKQWLHAIEGTAKRIVSALSGELFEKQASLYITVSGHGPSVVCLDKRDEVIMYFPWYKPEDVFFKNPEEFSPASNAAGYKTDSYFLPRIDIVRRSAPVFSRVQTVLTPSEYVVMALCGARAVCIPHEKYMPYMWSPQDIATYGFDAALFPASVLSGAVLGCGDTAFSRNLFPHFKNVYCVAGGLDYLSALIGCDFSPDSVPVVFQRSGTSVVLNAAVVSSEVCHINDALAVPRRFILPHFFSTHLNIGYSVQRYSELYQYLRCTAMFKTEADYENAMRLFDGSRGASSFVRSQLLPCLQQDTAIADIVTALQQRGISAARGRGAYFFNVLIHSVEDVFRAVCDEAGICFENAALAVSGGHAADCAFMQSCARFLNKTIYTFTPAHCELRGNFALGLYASGACKSIVQAVSFISATLPPRVYNP